MSGANAAATGRARAIPGPDDTRATAERGGTRKARQAGQATVELALLLPFVCGLLLVVVQVALITRDQIVLHHLTRETARAVALDGRAAPALAAGRATSGLSPDRLELTVEAAGDPSLLAVTARYRTSLVVPLVTLLRREVILESRLIVRAEPT